MIRGEPSAWRCARRPQSIPSGAPPPVSLRSIAGSAPGGRPNAWTGASSSLASLVSPASSRSPSSSSSGAGAPAALEPAGSVRVIAVVGASGLDVVLLHQLAEVLAIDVGGARGVRDVA